jgi:hypothetical protein
MRERAPHHQRRLVGDEDVREIAVGAQGDDFGRPRQHRAFRRLERDRPLGGGGAALASSSRSAREIDSASRSGSTGLST